MRILVDCDGVLADFCGAYLRLLQHLTGRAHTLQDVTTFNFAECVASPEEDADVWRAIDGSPGLVACLYEIEGAREGLAALRKLGDVRCLTAPHLGPFWMYERCRWLQGLGFAKREIVFAADKTLVPGHVLVEDSLANLKAWEAAHTGGVGVLLDAPYNRVGRGTELRVAGSWLEVVRLVEALDTAVA